jgi:hypothetical protein
MFTASLLVVHKPLSILFLRHPAALTRAGFTMRLEREGRGSRKPERGKNPKKKKDAINGSRLGVVAQRRSANARSFATGNAVVSRRN